MEKRKINSLQVGQIMNEWSKEVGESCVIFYNIRYTDTSINIYSDRPGIIIGRAGEMIERYKNMLKETGISKFNVVEITNARIPDIKYGMEICPLENEVSGICYDYNRLGIIACASCGTNKKLAEEGQKSILDGFNETL